MFSFLHRPVPSQGSKGAVAHLAVAALSLISVATTVVCTFAIKEPSSRGASENPLALHQASSLPAGRPLRSLLQKKPAPRVLDTPDPSGRTPLIIAAIHGLPSHIEHLISAGATLDHTDDTGATALGYAVAKGNGDAARLLLSLSASPDARTPEATPVLLASVDSDQHPLALELIANGATSGTHRTFLHAVTTGDLDLATVLVEAGVSPLPTTASPHLLDQAVASGSTPFAHLLLDHFGPDLISTASPDLLCQIISNGDHSLLNKAFALGADPSLSGDGSLPLSLALANHDLTSISILLDFCSPIPPSSLAEAIGTGDSDLVDLLLAAGADPDTPISPGSDPPLLAAVTSRDHELVSRLLAVGADTSISGTLGQPPLAVAVAQRDHITTSLLLQAGADPNVRLSSPVSGPFLELLAHSEKLIFYLRRDSRFTPLMLASGAADHATIRLLLKNGASRGLTTRSYRRYPVSFAFANGDILAQQLLLGRDPTTEPPEERRSVVIDLSTQTATLLLGNEPAAKTKISSGKKSTPTPVGSYVISDKHRHHTSSLYHVSMPYFQRLSGQAFGFHTGSLPGYPASHGCIRMPNSNAKKFFSLTRVGDPVTIVP